MNTARYTHAAEVLAQNSEPQGERFALIDEYDAWCTEHGYDPGDADVFDKWTWGPFADAHTTAKDHP